MFQLYLSMTSKHCLIMECNQIFFGRIRHVVPVFHSKNPEVRLRRSGVDQMNHRPLCHVSRSVGDPTVVRMAMVNSRSLVNKSFILNNFFYFTLSFYL